jgi:CrcB protein
MQAVLLIGVAGAFGAMSRYALGMLAERLLGTHFAFGTLLVNVLGCLALGFLLEVERATDLISHPARLLLAVGFLGAFTTFSTFGYETLRYFQNGAGQLGLLNISANLILGLAAVWLGFLGARSIYPVI